jgi:hypothetical protein
MIASLLHTKRHQQIVGWLCRIRDMLTARTRAREEGCVSKQQSSPVKGPGFLGSFAKNENEPVRIRIRRRNSQRTMPLCILFAKYKPDIFFN